MRIAKFTAKVTAVLLFALLGVILFGGSHKVYADYNQSLLIDDGKFLDASSMNAGQIQDFLNSHSGQLKSNTYYFDCALAGSTATTAYQSIGAPCGKTTSAANIIYYASQIYGMSPKAVLATIQKESSGITDPNGTYLSTAMGYGCPDNGGCSSSSSFFYQIDNGTWDLRRLYERARGNMDWWSHATSWPCQNQSSDSAYTYYRPGLIPGQTVSFYGDPGYNKGASAYATFLISNAATASLYCYTPHAYNNPQGINGLPAYGTAGPYYSGSYNFVKAYEQWFGITSGSYPQLDASSGGPRWMTLNTTATKVIPGTTNPYPNQQPLAAGTQLYFVDKMYVGGQWYLRTQFDHDNNIYAGIPQSAISDIQPISFDTPRYLVLKATVHKFNPRNGQPISDKTFPAGQVIYFNNKYIVNGQTFYTTAFDSSNGIVAGIYATSTAEVSNSFTPFDTPRAMTVSDGATTYNLSSDQAVSSYSSKTDVGFVDKLNFNGTWYYRTKSAATNGLPYGVPASSITEVPVHVIATPYTIAMTQNSSKKMFVDQSTPAGDPLVSGQVIKVANIVTINDVEYYQTAYDAQNNLQNGIPVSQTRVYQPNFISLDNPRIMALTQSLQKTDLRTGQPTGDTFPVGTQIRFSTKTEIDGEWYLRTQFDTDNNILNGIPINSVNID